MKKLDTASLSNQNITAPLLVHTWTSTGIYKIYCRLLLSDLVSASNAKSVLVYIQPNGSALSYRCSAEDTITSSATSIMLISDPFIVGSGDVVRISALGGAGDNANADITSELWGEELEANIEAILADTNELQTDDVPALIAAIETGGATVEEIDAALSATHGAGLWGGSAGSGASEEEITINDGSSPLDGVFVWACTDSGGANVVASGYTDALGLVTFYLDPGTYYVFKQLAGYTFANPSTLVVI